MVISDQANLFSGKGGLWLFRLDLLLLLLFKKKEWTETQHFPVHSFATSLVYDKLS